MEDSPPMKSPENKFLNKYMKLGKKRDELLQSLYGMEYSKNIKTIGCTSLCWNVENNLDFILRLRLLKI